jgi:hypothetical protein
MPKRKNMVCAAVRKPRWQAQGRASERVRIVRMVACGTLPKLKAPIGVFLDSLAM